MNETVKTSSIVNEKVQVPHSDQTTAPTWFVIVFLIFALIILKAFIYIKDDKKTRKIITFF
jgi:hypothetical protein